MTNALQRSLAAQLAGLDEFQRCNVDSLSPALAFAGFVYRKAGEVPSFLKDAEITLLTKRLEEAPILAAVGSAMAAGLWRSALPDEAAWLRALQRLQKRELFPVDRSSFAYRPLEVIGIALGLSCCGRRDDQQIEWLKGALVELGKSRGGSFWESTLYQLAGDVVGLPQTVCAPPQWTGLPPHELALARWAGGVSEAFASFGEKHFAAVDEALLSACLESELQVRDVAEAAVLSSSIRQAVQARLKAAPVDVLASAPDHVVVLIHGIRTHASWAEMVASVLARETRVKVVPLKYGFFDVFRFLCPLFTRRSPVARIVRELRDLRSQYPTARISVVAHSFGTYAVMKALKEPDIRLHRLILCGCIVKETFRRAKFTAQLGTDPILNDCGTHDVWPVLAKSITWGYGATGTFGFGTVGVRDRFNKFGHGDYFDDNFVETYWAPFIRDGDIRETEWERVRNTPPYWQSLLSWLPLRWLLLAVLVGLPLIAWLQPLAPKSRPLVRFGPKLGIGHWLGSPVVAAHVEFSNPTRKAVTFSNLELWLLGPRNKKFQMAVEANVIGPNFFPALTTVVVQPKNSMAFDYSFFNYDAEYIALQQGVAATLAQPGFTLGSPDPQKEILPKELTARLIEHAGKMFPWASGNWRVELHFLTGDTGSLAYAYYQLSDNEVASMISITNYYGSGIGVVLPWRFLTLAGTQPTLNKDLVHEQETRK